MGRVGSAWRAGACLGAACGCAPRARRPVGERRTAHRDTSRGRRAPALKMDRPLSMKAVHSRIGSLFGHARSTSGPSGVSTLQVPSACMPWASCADLCPPQPVMAVRACAQSRTVGPPPGSPRGVGTEPGCGASSTASRGVMRSPIGVAPQVLQSESLRKCARARAGGLHAQGPES